MTDIAALFAYDNSETTLYEFLSNGSDFSLPASMWDSGAGNWSGSDILIG